MESIMLDEWVSYDLLKFLLDVRLISELEQLGINSG